ncbi:hypothetical protein EDB85DRAFT_1896642 [Lactarius pseudohatsudake]|nr:hypothetical protein EDB85DRAFT_1896642 [Lactarius pseudohatsudake]
MHPSYARFLFCALMLTVILTEIVVLFVGKRKPYVSRAPSDSVVHFAIAQYMGLCVTHESSEYRSLLLDKTRAISHKTLKLQVSIGWPASGDSDPLHSAKFKFTDTLFYIKEGIGNVSGPEHPHCRNLRSTGRHNSNPSNADDEEDDAESTSDEEVDAAYRAAHYTTVTTFPGHVKRHGLQSSDGGYPFIALFGSVTDFGHRVGT